MADGTDNTGDIRLPPKLDLRKQGILKENPVAAAAAPAAAPKAQGETARLVVPEPTAAPAAPSPVLKMPEVRVQTAAGAPPAAPTPRPATPAAKPLTIAAKPLTVGGLKPPMAAPAAPAPPLAPEPAADADGKPLGKKETSRIPLETATGRPVLAADSAGVTPKTIKIKPTVPVPPRKATQPLTVNQPPTAGDEELERASMEKRKTSRIPLEAVMPAAAETGAPKTIKLKRPGEAAAPAAPAPKPGETSRIEGAAPAAEESPTRRKTIKVKRPDGIEAARPGAPSLAVAAIPEAAPGDEPGWPWAVTAMAAALVLCVAIYMFAAQTIAPDLPWPGKIMGQ